MKRFYLTAVVIAAIVASVLVRPTIAQNPPIPSVVPTFSVLNTTVSTISTLVTAPTAPLRLYIYEITCINSSGTATVATLSDSGGTSGSSVTTIGYVACPISVANGSSKVWRNPQRLLPGSTLKVTTAVGMDIVAETVTGR